MKWSTAAVALVLGIPAAGALFVYSGAYDVAATDQHTAAVYWLLKANMRESVHRRASTVRVPPIDDRGLIARGRVLYQGNCVRCHGAPGVAPESFALGLTPAPANLANTGREWPAADLYWTIRNGLKMTGMPAWEFRLSEPELWAIVAYVRAMPYESPQEYAMVRDTKRFAEPADAPSSVAGVTVGDVGRAKKALQQYACVTCHEIPGSVGATVPVGPSLERMGRRRFIAGKLANTPENMIAWLRDPQQVNPGSAMPNLGVTERDARDIAAYLETLR